MNSLKQIFDMSNEKFENYLLEKYGKKFNIVNLTEQEFARFEKTADKFVVEVMRNLRKN